MRTLMQFRAKMSQGPLKENQLLAVLTNFGEPDRQTLFYDLGDIFISHQDWESLASLTKACQSQGWEKDLPWGLFFRYCESSEQKEAVRAIWESTHPSLEDKLEHRPQLLTNDDLKKLAENPQSSEWRKIDAWSELVERGDPVATQETAIFYKLVEASSSFAELQRGLPRHVPMLYQAEKDLELIFRMTLGVSLVYGLINTSKPLPPPLQTHFYNPERLYRLGVNLLRQLRENELETRAWYDLERIDLLLSLIDPQKALDFREQIARVDPKRLPGEYETPHELSSTAMLKDLADDLETYLSLAGVSSATTGDFSTALMPLGFRKTDLGQTLSQLSPEEFHQEVHQELVRVSRHTLPPLFPPESIRAPSPEWRTEQLPDFPQEALNSAKLPLPLIPKTVKDQIVPLTAMITNRYLTVETPPEVVALLIGQKSGLHVERTSLNKLVTRRGVFHLPFQLKDCSGRDLEAIALGRAAIINHLIYLLRVGKLSPSYRLLFSTTFSIHSLIPRVDKAEGEYQERIVKALTTVRPGPGRPSGEPGWTATGSQTEIPPWLDFVQSREGALWQRKILNQLGRETPTTERKQALKDTAPPVRKETEGEKDTLKLFSPDKEDKPPINIPEEDRRLLISTYEKIMRAVYGPRPYEGLTKDDKGRIRLMRATFSPKNPLEKIEQVLIKALWRLRRKRLPEPVDFPHLAGQLIEALGLGQEELTSGRGEVDLNQILSAGERRLVEDILRQIQRR